MKSKCCNAEVKLIKEDYYNWKSITNVCSNCDYACEVRSEDEDERNARIRAMGLIMK